MKFFLLLLSFVYFASGNAQTVTYTIDYSFETGIGTSCNVFATDKTVDNYVHQTTKGFPNFIGSPDYYVNLACKRNSFTSQVGTDYQIVFPFKQGYKYQITANYKGTVANVNEPYPVLALTLNPTKKAKNTSTSCTGPQAISSFDYMGFAVSGSSLSWPSSPIINITNALTQNYEALSIAAIPWDGSNATGTQGIQIRKIQITEIAPVAPPITNDEYTGAITLTPSTSATCAQQTTVSFNNSTIPTSLYEPNWGALYGTYPDMLGDVWYKFTATNNTHAVNVSSPPSGYDKIMELYSLVNNNFKLIDSYSWESNYNISGLEIGSVYYVRVILLGQSTVSDNVSVNICVTTPVIQSPTFRLLSFTRYAEVGLPWIYDGTSFNISYQLSQNVPESDLSLDWRLIGGIPAALDGLFLYPYGGTRLNNGTYELNNVQGRRVQIGIDVKSPANSDFPVWMCQIQVRFKQISTNTYLTGWISDGQSYFTEL